MGQNHGQIDPFDSDQETKEVFTNKVLGKCLLQKNEQAKMGDCYGSR